MVREIHNGIKGRVRYKVNGLYRSPMLKTRLERLSFQIGEISSVHASILTGNVLVVFDPECNARLIASLIEKAAIDHSRSRRIETESASQETEDQSHRAGVPAQRARERKPTPLTPEVMAAAGQTSEPWHLMARDEVLSSFNSCAKSGLSAEAARTNCERYGLNVVPEPSYRSKLDIFLDQFNSLPVALLAAAAGVSVVTGGLADALVIMAVVGINAVIGYATETEAEKTINSLKQLIMPTAQIVREERIIEVSAEQVLLGDIITLKPGTYVTADARIVEANHLTVDESALTGESMPVTKVSEQLNRSDVLLADRVNMVYSGTLVTGGQGLAVVVASGIFSEIGKIQSLVAEAEAPETPIERQLDKIGNQLVLISGAICGLVFVIGLLRGNGFLQMLNTAISLAVAAVPEGLTAVATTTLALGVRNMRQQKVLIRNLDAVCTLGSIQTICFDKTGTITYNRMSVLRIYSGMERIEVREGLFFVGETRFNPFDSDEVLRLINVCVLCSETQIEIHQKEYVLNGSATENALVFMAINAGVDVQWLREQYPLLKTNYRADNRQYMSTVHVSPNPGRLIAVKGSPVEVLAKCEYQIKDGERILLTEEDRDRIEAENDSMAGDALRVLGMAYSVQSSDGPVNDDDCLVWLGLAGMADPIRERARESVMAFHQAGLETVMVTGDQSPTAYAVGRELGLNNGGKLEILDSTDLAGTDPAVLKALSKQVHVFARVSPSNKLQIVQALQSTGRVVAMTGDGINDGPALKAADIGIAMGRGGTDVAREVADVVLEEDDLETMIIAIRDGRTIYNNIRKTLHYLLATNFSEIQVMFAAGALGLGYPLNPMQLLWINLVSDIFPGLALAMEPAEPDIMSRPPRDPAEPIVKKDDFKRITFEAATMTVASLTAYGYGIMKYGMGPAAGSMAFHSLTTSQILHSLSCRSENRSSFDAEMPPNKYLNAAVLGSLALQLTTLFVPGLRSLLGLTPLAVSDALVIGAASLVPLLVNEATKPGVDGHK
ncbi:MAG: cation-transporting P-type ATPase [Desulfomonile tiedjei]|uniref:Cation-transporting P-type ATPase n=1 Tax=Desulfomonile tiedjei TaxID=2358 RepID=A0A9D6Z597_9BACT|nr:cation-transporting P-type ATPase [Desulfomonile tiedjei]